MESFDFKEFLECKECLVGFSNHSTLETLECINYKYCLECLVGSIDC